jgi:hypothetical protein
MFRQLRADELLSIAWEIKEVWYTRGILAFAREIYGEQAYQVLIQDDGDTYDGPTIHDVEVTDRESNEILPDFTLPYWQEVLRVFPEYFDECKTQEEKLALAKQFLRDDEIYSDKYALDPERVGKVIVLSELWRTAYPELYRKEGN